MRKCIRCEVKLKENFDVKVEGAAYGLKITKPGIFKLPPLRFVRNLGLMAAERAGVLKRKALKYALGL